MVKLDTLDIGYRDLSLFFGTIVCSYASIGAIWKHTFSFRGSPCNHDDAFFMGPGISVELLKNNNRSKET